MYEITQTESTILIREDGRPIYFSPLIEGVALEEIENAFYEFLEGGE